MQTRLPDSQPSPTAPARYPEPPSAPSTRPGGSGRFTGLLAGLLVLALLARALQIAEFVRSNPIADRPWSDGWVYWQMAGRMAQGQWFDGHPFFSAPLYPYLLGGLRTLGGGLFSVYAGQLILHLLTAVLIALAARRRFGPSAGLLAAALFLTLSEPAVAVTRVLGNTLQVFLFALLWWRWAAAAEQPDLRRRDVALVGALIGLTALAFPAALLLAPAFALWLLASPGRASRRVGRALGGLAASALLVAPATLHNVLVGGELVPVSVNAGINLAIGNNENVHGIGGNIPGVRPMREYMFADAAHVYEQARGTPGSWREIDTFFRQRALAYWRQHPDRALRQLGEKAYWLLAAQNYDQMMPLVIERQLGITRLWVLAPLPVPWLMGAALIALPALLRRPRHFAPEWLSLLLPLIVVCAFFYTARFRLPAVPVLCGIAAWTIVQCLRRRKPWLRAAPLILLIPLGTRLANRHFGIDRIGDDYRTHFVRAFSEAYTIRGNRCIANDRPAEAERALTRALELWDGNARARQALGRLLAREKQYARAVEQFRKLVRLAPENRAGWYYLYNALCLEKHYLEAADALRAIVTRFPDRVQPQVALAWLYATCPDPRARNGPEALRLAQRCMRARLVRPAQAADLLAAAYAELGRFAEAVEAARAALRALRNAGQTAAVRQLQTRLRQYEQQRPWHGPPRLLRAD